MLQRVVHETAKMGSDNPDNFYQNAAISGEHTYRLWGKRGTVHYLSFGTQIGHYGKGRGMPPSGALDASQMTIEDDGSFEIVISCEEPEGDVNWLPMKPETGTLIVRQTRLDPATEELAEIRIEPTGGVKEPTPVTPKLVDEGLTQSGQLVHYAAMMFATWAEGFEKHVNELPEFDRNMASLAGGDPNIVYYHSYWKLAPDEALVIDATPPECDHWNFQLNNHWMESLDYRHFRIHVNSKTATLRDDGSVRIVVAHEDPGVPNWIRTVGHDSRHDVLPLGPRRGAPAAEDARGGARRGGVAPVRETSRDYRRPHRPLAIALANRALPKLGSLDPEALMDAAKGRTGLDDFGVPPFDEGAARVGRLDRARGAPHADRAPHHARAPHRRPREPPEDARPRRRPRSAPRSSRRRS